MSLQVVIDQWMALSLEIDTKSVTNEVFKTTGPCTAKRLRFQNI